MAVDIRLTCEALPPDSTEDEVEAKNLVTPGSIITRETGFMR